MRTRDAIGRKIVGVRQERVYNSQIGRLETFISSITLDNGTRIVFSVSPTEADYGVVATAHAKQRGK